MNRLFKLCICNLVLIIFLVSCSNSTNVSEDKEDINLYASSFEKLLDDYPQLESTYNRIPTKLHDKIVAPSLEEIPFKVEEVQLDYDNDPTGMIPAIMILYTGDNKRVTSTVWYHDGTSIPGKELLLDHGIKAFYLNNIEEIAITWRDPDKNSKLLYRVGLLTFEKGSLTKAKNQLSKDDAVSIANSMINNYYRSRSETQND